VTLPVTGEHGPYERRAYTAMRDTKPEKQPSG
jgi:hypothetical protein